MINRVAGKEIQIDRSGVGHCWINVKRAEIPMSTVYALEVEILDNKVAEMDEIVTEGGQVYRWVQPKLRQW